jgi:predicted kinase
VTNAATLIATIGPPGAGKSTWCRHHTPFGARAVKLDSNRALLAWCHCPANQSVTPLAVEMGMATARAVLARGGTVVWDATNAERVARSALQVLAAEYGARTVAVLILPPLAVSLARNESRDPRRCACGWSRRVPEEAIRAMDIAIRQDLRRITIGEGWHEVRHWPRNH